VTAGAAPANDVVSAIITAPIDAHKKARIAFTSHTITTSGDLFQGAQTI
jgi:hypothetical protein